MIMKNREIHNIILKICKTIYSEKDKTLNVKETQSSHTTLKNQIVRLQTL